MTTSGKRRCAVALRETDPAGLAYIASRQIHQTAHSPQSGDRCGYETDAGCATVEGDIGPAVSSPGKLVAPSATAPVATCLQPVRRIGLT